MNVILYLHVFIFYDVQIGEAIKTVFPRQVQWVPFYIAKKNNNKSGILRANLHIIMSTPYSAGLRNNFDLESDALSLCHRVRTKNHFDPLMPFLILGFRVPTPDMIIGKP